MTCESACTLRTRPFIVEFLQLPANVLSQFSLSVHMMSSWSRVMRTHLSEQLRLKLNSCLQVPVKKKACHFLTTVGFSKAVYLNSMLALHYLILVILSNTQGHSHTVKETHTIVTMGGNEWRRNSTLLFL